MVHHRGEKKNVQPRPKTGSWYFLAGLFFFRITKEHPVLFTWRSAEDAFIITVYTSKDLPRLYSTTPYPHCLNLKRKQKQSAVYLPCSSEFSLFSSRVSLVNSLIWHSLATSSFLACVNLDSQRKINKIACI